MNILMVLFGIFIGLCLLLALAWLLMSPARRYFVREQMKSLSHLRARYRV